MNPFTKQLADFLTWVRALLAPLLVWLGLAKGVEALPLVVILMILNWTIDSIDGPLARRNPIEHQTWIGERDLEIDMFISCGMLAYLFTAGFLSWQVAAIYLILWTIIFWRKGFLYILCVLFQLPIYGWFIFLTIREAPLFGLAMTAWTVVAITVTWPKFPKVIVPDLMNGLRDLWQKDQPTPG